MAGSRAVMAATRGASLRSSRSFLLPMMSRSTASTSIVPLQRASRYTRFAETVKSGGFRAPGYKQKRRKLLAPAHPLTAVSAVGHSEASELLQDVPEGIDVSLVDQDLVVEV